MKLGRLRLRGVEPDALLARLRVERVLGGVELSLPGLPPSAILCIRQLKDPRPGRVSLRQHELRPPADWEQALGTALRERLSHTARPALGAVPATAEAVLFADASELLACLASDVCGGRAAACWWWHGLYRDTDLRRQLVKEWCQRPEYVPAALELLTARGEAQAFLRALGDEEARELLVRVAGRHGLRSLMLALEGATAALAAPGPSLPEREHETGLPAEAPWERYAPEARGDTLGLEQRTLLGVALLLRRALAEAHRPTFAPAVARWRQAEARALSSPQPANPLQGNGQIFPLPSGEGQGEGVRTRSSTRGPQCGQEVQPGFTRYPHPVPLPKGEGKWPQGRSSLPARSSVPAPERQPGVPRTENLPLLEARSVPRGHLPDVPSKVAPDFLPAREESPAPVPAPSPPASTVTPETRGALRPWTGSPIHTGLGGLFYLLNLGLFLELYGDFSTPASPGIPLPVWDFVTLLGRRLLVEAHPEDPLWDVLARLAGRGPGVAPGADFEPPEEWRVPPSWLRPFREPGTWHWDRGTPVGRPSPQPSPRGRGSLRVLHPAGFLVMDVPASHDEGEVQARRECEPYGPSALAPAPLPPPGDETSPLERWLGWLVPYVRARLQRALGERDPAGLARLLLEHEARVHVTEAHVDIVFPLASLPLPIRFAGLDRDIGWLPAAGRHVLFHFE